MRSPHDFFQILCSESYVFIVNEAHPCIFSALSTIYVSMPILQMQTFEIYRKEPLKKRMKPGICGKPSKKHKRPGPLPLFKRRDTCTSHGISWLQGFTAAADHLKQGVSVRDGAKLFTMSKTTYSRYTSLEIGHLNKLKEKVKSAECIEREAFILACMRHDSSHTMGTLKRECDHAQIKASRQTIFCTLHELGFRSTINIEFNERQE